MAIQLLLTRAGGHVFHAGPLLIVHDHGPITHESVAEDFKAVQPVIDRYDEVSFLRVFEIGRASCRERVYARV